ncbi:MAG TPA: hypothetical protein DEP69_00215 [Acidimicrobiaceae bacterium]|nr:hypothetical protein [Acidimicrobiaceae bacterium]
METTTGPSPRRVKFASLATKRVNNASNAIRLIGNLANRSNYEYTEGDISVIIRELNEAVNDMKRQFSTGGKRVSDFHIAP